MSISRVSTPHVIITVCNFRVKRRPSLVSVGSLNATKNVSVLTDNSWDLCETDFGHLVDLNRRLIEIHNVSKPAWKRRLFPEMPERRDYKPHQRQIATPVIPKSDSACHRRREISWRYCRRPFMIHVRDLQDTHTHMYIHMYTYQKRKLSAARTKLNVRSQVRASSTFLFVFSF